MSFDCSGGISFLSREDVFKAKEDKKVRTSTTNLNDIMAILVSILGDADEAIAIAEIVIDTDTIQSEWEDGDYFEAGLYSGKGSVNAAYTLYATINKFIQHYSLPRNY